MDQRFLEFLGNLLLSAARGQKLMADIFSWMQQGYSGYEELTAMFRKFYGLETPSPSAVEGQKRDEKAFQDFQQSFNAYLRLWGVVSESEHRHLLDKLKKLEDKCDEQEKIIRNLKQLLDLKLTDQNEFFQTMQDIMAGQSQVVQQMLKSFWEIGQSSQSTL